MKKAIDRGNFDAYLDRNLKIHDVDINLSGNRMLKNIVDKLKNT